MGMARGITDQDNRDGPELLSSVNPTFTWVRLAQRIPVRIRLTQVLEGVLVSAGMTCRVIMKDGMQPIGASMKYLIARHCFDGRAAMVVQRRLAPGFRGRGGEVHRGRTCWRTRDFHRCVPDQPGRGEEEAGAGDQPIAWPKAEEASRAFAQLPARKVGICVSTVSIVCGPTGHLQGWARARSTAVVANGICRTSGLLLF
jgi:hypothetical protein